MGLDGPLDNLSRCHWKHYTTFQIFLESDLSISMKVQSNNTFGLPIYGFLLVLNSTRCSNSPSCWYLRVWNVEDLWTQPSKLLRAKFSGTPPTHNLLLVYYSKIWSRFFLTPNISKCDWPWIRHSRSNLMPHTKSPQWCCFVFNGNMWPK